MRTEIAEVERLLKDINNLVTKIEKIELLDTPWEESPIMKRHLLTMDDLKRFDARLNTHYYVIEPQTYDRVSLLSPRDLEYFFDSDGLAVTGTGSDPWIVYSKDLTHDLGLVYTDLSSLYDDLRRHGPKKQSKDEIDAIKKAKAAIKHLSARRRLKLRK